MRSEASYIKAQRSVFVIIEFTYSFTCSKSTIEHEIGTLNIFTANSKAIELSFYPLQFILKFQYLNPVFLLLL